MGRGSETQLQVGEKNLVELPFKCLSVKLKKSKNLSKNWIGQYKIYNLACKGPQHFFSEATIKHNIIMYVVLL